MSDDAEGIAKTQRLAKSDTNVNKADEVIENKIEGLRKNEVHGIEIDRSNHGRYTNRLDYLHNKFGAMSASELHAEINRPQLRRMLEDYSPSDYARN
ncbi:hypothetical protein ABNN70_06910 [Sporolactobacillus sp. Y61]|uniref:Uncharacterized protein n=1 Tax=Sporolactobacillus sp. Y61 TaxID=3160863 RepID=A0AAU8IJ95_9BACL